MRLVFLSSLSGKGAVSTLGISLFLSVVLSFFACLSDVEEYKDMATYKHVYIDLPIKNLQISCFLWANAT